MDMNNICVFICLNFKIYSKITKYTYAITKCKVKDVGHNSAIYRRSMWTLMRPIVWHLCEQSASGEGVVYKLYLAQYAHTLPSILPDVAHRLPDALGQNLFGLSALGERDLQS